MIKSRDIEPFSSTGIGSLPNRESGAALDLACTTDIPYFPSLPQLDAQQGILSQALAGFPGIFWKTGGESRFEFSAWERGRGELAERLGRAFDSDSDLTSRFADSVGLWGMFLERLRHHPGTWAKAQLLGPVTAILSIPGLDKVPQGTVMELAAQITEWLFAKALRMTSELSGVGKRVIFFWDEPAMGSPEALHPMALLAAEQLRERIGLLKNFGAEVGIHCCGDWDFGKQLCWPQEIVSFDWALSGGALLEAATPLKEFHGRGGRLALGLVPTRLASTWNSRQEVEQCWTRFSAALGEADAKVILAESLLTPACGLGQRTREECAAVFAALRECQEYLREYVRA